MQQFPGQQPYQSNELVVLRGIHHQLISINTKLLIFLIVFVIIPLGLIALWVFGFGALLVQHR